MASVTAGSARELRNASFLTVAKGARESIAKSALLTAANADNVRALADACKRISSHGSDMASLMNAANGTSKFWDSSKQARDLMRATADIAERAALLVTECSVLATQRDMIKVLDELEEGDTHVMTPALRSSFARATEQVRTAARKSAEGVRLMQSLTVEFAGSAGAVGPLASRVPRMRAANLYTSPELFDLSVRIATETSEALALLRAAIESSIAADAAVVETAAYPAWIGKLARSERKPRQPRQGSATDRVHPGS